MLFTEAPATDLASRRNVTSKSSKTSSSDLTKSKGPKSTPKRAAQRKSASGSRLKAKAASKAKGRQDQSKPLARKKTKQAILIEMLRRQDGATIPELVKAIRWQVHSIRGAMSGALKKKLGLTIESQNVGARGRTYRIPT